MIYNATKIILIFLLIFTEFLWLMVQNFRKRYIKDTKNKDTKKDTKNCMEQPLQTKLI